MASTHAEVKTTSDPSNFFYGQLGGPRALNFHYQHVEIPKYNFLKEKKENVDLEAAREHVEREGHPLGFNVLFGHVKLFDLIGKRIQATLNDGRNIVGNLVSVDHFSNLIMQNTVERIFVGQEYGDIPRGVFVIRGDNLVMLGEVGEEKETEMQRRIRKVSLNDILIAQKTHLEMEQAKQLKHSQALKQRGCCSRRPDDEF